jgi:uncharacterized membrane protein
MKEDSSANSEMPPEAESQKAERAPDEPKLPAPPQNDSTAESQLKEKVEAALKTVIVEGNKRAEVTEAVISVVRREKFHGPLPHPRHLQAYEKACPGLADRIVAMAEKGQDRSENRIDKLIDYEYGDRRLGMYLGFAALIGILAAGCFLIWLGATAIGTTLLGAAVIGTVVGTFVHGRRQKVFSLENDDDEEPATEGDGTPEKTPKPPAPGGIKGFLSRLMRGAESAT